MEARYPKTGTTSPIYVACGESPTVIRPGESYFLVKIHSAQAAYRGSMWHRATRLLVTSQVTLNVPALGSEPVRALQRSREVQRGRAEQLGVASNLISLVPAAMDHISISIEFLLDRENRMAPLVGLINNDTFLSSLSFAPGMATVARTVGSISEGLLEAFLDAESRHPILQFLGDFNITTGELREGYYILLGSRDKESPLPSSTDNMELQGHELLHQGEPITQWSYVVLRVATTEVRTRDLCNGATWDSKLHQAESLAESIRWDPIASKEKKQQAWHRILDLIREAQVILNGDAGYLKREAEAIVRCVYQQCREDVLGPASADAPTRFRGVSGGAEEPEGSRETLGIGHDEDLHQTAMQYQAQVAAVKKRIREEGIR